MDHKDTELATGLEVAIALMAIELVSMMDQKDTELATGLGVAIALMTIYCQKENYLKIMLKILLAK